MQTIIEAAREVPVVEEADVVICGGGPAGVAAAVAAARAGARTRLLEVRGYLGGVWTAGLITWIIDAARKEGILREIVEVLTARGARDHGGVRTREDFAFDPEEMKLVLDELCLGAGVQLQLHTRVVAAVVDETGALRYCLTESKSGRQAWRAKVFVDATGDGDLAAHAGCGFDLGRPGTGQTQPMSLGVLVTGLDYDAVMPYLCGGSGGEIAPKRRLELEMERAGTPPSYATPPLMFIREGLYNLVANHEYGVLGTDAAQITTATLRARAELHRIVNALRAQGGVWRNLRIVASAEQIGVREGRRIHGLYQVTAEDMLRGARHEDGVCRVTFPVDVHSTDPSKGKGYGREGMERSHPYDVPLRALIARDVRRLLLAGRCISGDFLAHASYRVTGNAVPLGEAAGVLAALAAQRDELPEQVPWAAVARALKGQG
jgi:hypothetical protein